jgi:hypothetical protein
MGWIDTWRWRVSFRLLIYVWVGSSVRCVYPTVFTCFISLAHCVRGSRVPCWLVGAICISTMSHVPRARTSLFERASPAHACSYHLRYWTFVVAFDSMCAFIACPGPCPQLSGRSSCSYRQYSLPQYPTRLSLPNSFLLLLGSYEIYGCTHFTKLSSSLLLALIGGEVGSSAFLPPMESATPVNVVARVAIASYMSQDSLARCSTQLPNTPIASSATVPSFQASLSLRNR